MSRQVRQLDQGPGRDLALALAERHGEPDWLRELRLQAWEAFERAPLPHWQYTDARRVAVDPVLAGAPQAGPQAAPAGLPDELRAMLAGERPAGGVLLQVDGAPAQVRLAEALAERGVILTDLHTAVRRHPDLVRRYLLSQGADLGDRFFALHAALWSGGAFLYVPERVEVDLPVYFFQALSRPGAAAMPHNLVVLDRGARLTFFEEYTSPDGLDGPYAGPYTECYLEDGAQLRYFLVQRWGQDVTEVSRRQVFVGRDARVTTTVAYFGAGLMRTEVRSELIAEGGSSEIICLVLATGTQHLDIVTQNRHVAPHTSGEMLTRQVLRDRSRTAYSGMIVIERSAPFSTDYLQENALVLDPGARADAIPGLEIMNDEVAATHGATVGQIDEEQLFYLTSRGIPRRAAEQLIVMGFFDPLLGRIPEPETAERLRQLIARKAGL